MAFFRLIPSELYLAISGFISAAILYVFHVKRIKSDSQKELLNQELKKNQDRFVEVSLQKEKIQSDGQALKDQIPNDWGKVEELRENGPINLKRRTKKK